MIQFMSLDDVEPDKWYGRLEAAPPIGTAILLFLDNETMISATYFGMVNGEPWGTKSRITHWQKMPDGPEQQ